MQFPKHISLELSHNDHKNVYYTVQDVVDDQPDYFGASNWVSPEQLNKAIAADDMWTLHWYPETPVGFCVLHAADLDVLLAAAMKE